MGKGTQTQTKAWEKEGGKHVGHEIRREENNKEVMMKCDQNQKKKTRHCLMDMKHKGCAV